MSAQPNALETLKIERPTEPAPRRRAWVWLVSALALLLAGAGAAIWGQSRPAVVRTVVARPAETNAAAGTVLNASGYVTARRRATVSSKATAMVVEVLIEEGKRVEAGQVLARLDTSNLEANRRLAQAQAAATEGAVDETRALLQRAELEWKRTQPLAEQKIASPSELDRVESDMRSLRARLAMQLQQKEAGERQVAVWNQEIEDRTVRAPFAGVVVSKDAQPGEMISPVSAGGFIRTGIGTLVDMSSLEIEVDVNESYINRVVAGQRVIAKLDAYPDWTIPAKVIAVIPTADRQKATVKVRIGFDQLDPRILPDMGVKVAFHGEDNPASPGAAAVRVPAAALRKLDGNEIVWVVRASKLERRAVRSDKDAIGPEVTLLAGLSAGERVVVEGPAELAEGSRVRERNP